jgi:hypothetical protein
MSNDDVTSSARLGEAIKAMAHGKAGSSVEVTVGVGDWLTTLRIHVVRVAPRAKPKRVGGVLVVHPKRSAPGKRPR